MDTRQRSILKRIIFIVGPTSSGKTEIAFRLAKKINAEIISCDSMQAYNGMEILTQKPDRGILKKIPHHLIGILSPEEEYSAAIFCEKARPIIKNILARGKIPIVTGGTGLYAKALIDGLFPSPAKDDTLRQELAKEDASRLYEKLKRIDKASAEKIHPNDKRRIVRSLEIYYKTGLPPSEHKKNTCGIADLYDILIIGLGVKRDILYKRIEARVDRMFKKGLVKEVGKLAQKNLSITAKAALGYKEVRAHLDGGISLGEAVSLLKKNTWHYAKRQLTWFRADKRIVWIDADRPPEKAAEEICGKGYTCNG